MTKKEALFVFQVSAFWNRYASRQKPAQKPEITAGPDNNIEGFNGFPTNHGSTMSRFYD
jgi:hypothetical protein